MTYRSSSEELAEKIGKSIQEKEPTEFFDQLRKYGFLGIYDELEIKDLVAIIKTISRYNLSAGLILAINWNSKLFLKSKHGKTSLKEKDETEILKDKISASGDDITFSTNLKPDGKFFPFANLSEFIIEAGNETIKILPKGTYELTKISSLSFDLFKISKKEKSIIELDYSPHEFFSKLYFFIDCAISGTLDYALDLVQRYASERIQGGKPIKDYFAIKEKIYKISEFLNIVSEIIDSLSKNPERIQRKSLFLTSFTMRECPVLLSEAIQVFGGYGYVKDYKIEQLYREAETLKSLTEVYKYEFSKTE